MRWVDSLRDEIIRAARQSRTMPELAQRASALVGEPVHEEQVRGAVRRWRMRWPEIPELARLLGADLRGVQVANSNEAPPSPELIDVPAGYAVAEPSDADIERVAPVVVPKDARPPEPPVDSSARDPVECPRSILCISDIHIPIHDQAAVDAVVAFARDVRPEVIVINGDAFDVWSVSTHEKEPERLFDVGARLQEEFDAGRPLLEELAATADRTHFVLGNHEKRIARLVTANPGLFGLRALEFAALAGLPPRIRCHDYGTRLRVGLLNFIHGDRLGGRFGLKHPTAWVLDNLGHRSTVLGHTHRLGQSFRTVWDEDGNPHQYVAINSGHLSDVRKQKYVTEPNWQTGCVFVEGWTEAGRPRFTPHLIPIVGGRFSFGGRSYGRRCQ